MLKPTAPVEDLHLRDHTKAPTAERDVGGRSTPRAGSGADERPGGSPSPVEQPKVLHPPTSEEILGPYYPTHAPAGRGHDLTFIVGREACALGTVVHLSGRGLNRRGEPIPDADLDIWQANAAGRYAHPADENPAPIDPNFEGHARIRTGPDGRWSLKTIKPGGYPVTPDWSRPPHIHFDVKGRVSRLVTQMYFEGEPLNDKDILLQRAWGKETLVARYLESTMSAELVVLVAQWDIVLLGG